MTNDFDDIREAVRQVAPISTNLVVSHVATHALNMPKSL